MSLTDGQVRRIGIATILGMPGPRDPPGRLGLVQAARLGELERRTVSPEEADPADRRGGGPVRLHRALRAEDADDGRPRAQGRPLLGHPAEKIDRVETRRAGARSWSSSGSIGASWRMVRAPEVSRRRPSPSRGVVSDLAALRRSGGDGAEARPADYGLEKPVADGDRSSGRIPTTPSPARRGRSSSEPTFPAPTSSRRGSPVRRRSSSCPSSVLAGLKKNVDDFLSKDVFGGSAVRGDPHRDPARTRPPRPRCARTARGGWPSPSPTSRTRRRPTGSAGQLTALRAREFVRGGVDLAAQGAQSVALPRQPSRIPRAP